MKNIPILALFYVLSEISMAFSPPEDLATLAGTYFFLRRKVEEGWKYPPPFFSKKSRKR